MPVSVYPELGLQANAALPQEAPFLSAGVLPTAPTPQSIPRHFSFETSHVAHHVALEPLILLPPHPQ